MNNWLIEQFLRSMQARWTWLTLGRRVGTAGAVICVAWFLVQLAAREGYITRLSVVHMLEVGMISVTLFTALAILVAALAGERKRVWLAGALENSCPPLLDRVNTLVHIEQSPQLMARSATLKNKIADQASSVLRLNNPRPAFAAKQTWLRLGIFVLALTGVILFEKYFHPFDALEADANPAKKNAPFQLAPQPNVAETEPRKTWGEVRIVDPGHDVRLTKIDVLPLQIEMTTSDTMQKPQWVTSINGSMEVPHDLAAPTDPNYMVYQPLIYLDQMAVNDWDVVAYYARVHSAAPADYASPINFIEIRPFREDILKLTGGDGKDNKRYQLLNEITGLIKRQTELIQQTHQHQQISYPKDEMRLQDAHKLSDGENDLSTSTEQTYGEIASADENTPVGDILSELAQAEQQMNQAVPPLKDDVATEGKAHEEGALAHLIATRKAFQKMLSDNPNAMGQGGPQDQTPSISDSVKALSQVSEMHDRNQAAMQSLQQLTQQQQALAQSKQTMQARQGQQLKIKSGLHDLVEKNPDLFQGSENQQADVQQNMMQSIVSLSSGDAPGAKTALDQTAASMQNLEKAVGENHSAQQMAQAYKLKKIIDQNAQQLGQEQSKPGSLSSQEAKDLAQSARQSTETLKDIVSGDQQGAFGPQLGQSLSPGNQQALDGALNQFGNSSAGAARSAAAGGAQKDLQGVSKAFEQSQPTLTQQMRQQDALQPSQGDALSQAQQDLQSMILAQEGKPGGGNASGQGGPDQQKAMDQVLHELREGLAEPGKAGGIIHDQLMADADKLEKKKDANGFDSAELKKLLDEIQSYRTSVTDPAQPKPPELNTTQIDPSKFPPAYRDRLRAYFEQLSQQAH